ncbi:MAG: hypothetical protein IPK82_01760 [Polyangiaceae bacterium]|nr:hypothetical protein [Polyangiaceae bacterium]
MNKRALTLLSASGTALVCALVAIPARADGVPQLAWDKPVRCLTDNNGKVVRVQCETKGDQTECLVTPNESKYGGEIDRAKPCDTVEPEGAYERLAKDGTKFTPALAEAPPGYARAATGKAYQVKFDLLNRVYLGASWVPTFQLNAETLKSPADAFARGQAEMGIHISVLSHKGRSRHDIRILEGTATFADLELRGLLFAYDYQHVHRRPAFYLTSFFGQPRLYEVAPPLGWGFRVLRVADRPPAFKNTLDMEFAEAHLAWNPWQSEDMYNHVRIQAGLDIGKFWQDRQELSKGIGTGTWYAGFNADASVRLALGDSGLHYTLIEFNYSRPNYLEGPKAGEGANNFTLKASYEGIFVAINDQPLSFRVTAEGASREDPFTGQRNMEVRAMAGLRFSFWAPPKVFEPLPEFEDP